jgi:hypothetical protein
MSNKIGRPRTAPPKPRPVLTKPIQVNIMAIINNSKGEKIINLNGSKLEENNCNYKVIT